MFSPSNRGAGSLAARGRMLAETNLRWYDDVKGEIERRIQKKKSGPGKSRRQEEALG